MSMPQRREIRTDFRLGIDARGTAPAPAAPPWVRVPALGPSASASSSLPVSASAVTRRLEEVWSSAGGGQGGRPLDDSLTTLGESYIQNDRVVWEAPGDLDPEYVDYLGQSVEQLNSLIDRGLVEIDADGNIRPTAS
jgi:hypothetical protein